MEKRKAATPPPSGYIFAKPVKATKEEIEAARKRYFARKAAGGTRADVVLSDDES